MPPKVAAGAADMSSLRTRIFKTLNGQNQAGVVIEYITVSLILLNLIAFVLGTVKGYEFWVYKAFDDLENVSVVIFTIEYLLRLYGSADDPEHKMFDANRKHDESMTRMRWMMSFYSVIDLFSIVPYYLDAYSVMVTKAACGGAGIDYDLPAFQFLRMFRLFRVMRMEGRYLEAFTVFDDIYAENKKLLFTSGFVGTAVWIILSGANWACERANPAMEGRFDTILSSSYFTLCNLFGEFPVVNERTPAGKFVAVITAGIAVAVFAIPTGIFGNGFQEHAEKNKKDLDVKDEDLVPKPGDDMQSQVYKFLYGLNPLGVLYERCMLVLIVANVTGFIVGSTAWAEKDKDVSAALDSMEHVSIAVFSVDYVLRFYAIGIDKRYSGFMGRLSYMTTFYALVDLAAVLPFYISYVSPTILAGFNISFIRALRLLRMLKMESYMKVFTVFDDILANNKDVLTVTGFAAVVLWIFFSSVMHFLEKDNPKMIGPRGDNYYKDIPSAMWPTLLNLCGEVPLADYTPLGKVISGIMGVVAVGSFAIPIGILGAGFEEWVSERYGGEEEEDTEAKAQPTPDTLTGKIWDFVEGRGTAGAWFQTAMFYLVFGTVAQQALETVPSVHKEYSKWLEGIEFASVCIFSFEYLLRLISAQHDPVFKGKGMPQIRFLFSFYAIIDVLTIAPYFWTLAYPGGKVDQYDEPLRMLRLLRLLKMDKIIPSVTLIDDVFRNNAVPLGVTGFAASVFWVIFSTLMWMAEDGDKCVPGDNGISQGQRFQDVPSAMPYTLILLSGDYPLLDFTFWGQVTCFFMCLFAVSVVSIPSSIIASGFTDVALAQRKKLGRSQAAVKEVKKEPPSYLNDGSMGADIHSLLSPDDDRGIWFDRLMLAFIATNVIVVVAESDAAIRKSYGDDMFSYYEGVAATVYLFLYVLRLVAAPYDRRAGYSVWGYLTSFFGIADFLAFAPFFAELAFMHYGIEYDFAWVRVVRLLRVLQLEHYTEAFTLIDDVFRECKDTLVATSYLAVIIWVGAAYCFFLTERNNPNVEGAFVNIPNSLYYTAIFLSGEWGQIDFTPLGKGLCMVLVVAGIGLYSIPVGALFDAFGEVLGDDEDDKEKAG